MRHSTGKPTKEESARIVACKEGPCMACEVLREGGMEGCDGAFQDYHHMKSGNIRIGHMVGIGLCAYHHRKHPLDGWPFSDMYMKFGPSLMDGGKKFAAVFGTDEELLQRQNDWLGEGNG